jgi:hypothetical protein
VELAGRHFAFGLQRRPNVGPRPHEIHSIRADLFGLPLLEFTSGENEPTFGQLARADGWVGWTLIQPSTQTLQRTRVPGGSVQAWPTPGGFGPEQGFTSGNGHAFEQAGALVVWPLAGSPLAQPLPGPIQVLPGA